MTTIQEILLPLVASNPTLALVILFVAIFIVGNIVSFTALWIGFRYFSDSPILFAIIATVFLADIANDLVWYHVARRLRGTRVGLWIHAHIPHHDAIEEHLRANARRWILLSKYISFSTFAIIFSVGWVGVPFSLFFPNSLLAIGTSVPILIAISFALSKGLVLLEATALFHRLEWMLLVGIVVFFVVRFILGKAMRTWFDK